MAKERLFNLPETKGQFQLKGIVSGTRSDMFFSDKKTKNNKGMKTANFAVEYDKDKKLYVRVFGCEQDTVPFYKKGDKDGAKGETIKVPWNDRKTYNRDGYKLIGVNVGVRKKIDEKGNEVNDKKVLMAYDAAQEIYEYLEDDVSVFVRGSLSYNSYIDKNDNHVNQINLDPNQVSLCSDVNFNEDDFDSVNDFNQTIVFTEIRKETDDNGKTTDRFVVTAKIITYNTIEDAEFIMTDSKLANLFKKKLKPYTSIEVSGHMVSEPKVEEVSSDDDDWGEPDKMKKTTAPTKREFIITGAKPKTIDTTTYTEDNVMEAIAKVNRNKNADNQFGSDDWGDTSSFDNNEDEAWD